MLFQKELSAHRVAYELFNGPAPEELLVRHSCDNPPCVRPDHLLLGTHRDNMEDRFTRDRFVTLNNETVGEIKTNRDNLTMTQLSVRYQVSYDVIHRIMRERSWRRVHVPVNLVLEPRPERKPARRRLKDLSPVERVMRKVSVIHNDCWAWTGKLQWNGAEGKGGVTPTCMIGGRVIHALRFLYEHHKGVSLGGRSLLHCKTTLGCVNPDHVTKIFTSSKVVASGL
jgi:hypothetical protein